jgi:hypothetical protein
MNTKIKYYCVWGEDESILVLTTDYGIALDMYAQHLESMGRLTDDQWSDTTAYIEEFGESFPSDREDIMDSISDSERLAWKHGETIAF